MGTERGSRRVTSTDVARESNVSRATVSYVLNGTPGHRISEATRERVLETARRLNHVPFAPARSLRLGKTSIVLALVRDHSVGFISNRALRRLDNVLAERGYIVLVHRYDDSLRSLDELWSLVAPAAVVSMGGLSLPEVAHVESTSMKFFQIHGIVPHEQAGAMQAEYLHGKGHRRLGYAFPSAPSLELVAQERLTGVRSASASLGLGEPDVQLVDIDAPESVYDALDAWGFAERESGGPERRGNGITAVAAHNDEIAMMICSGLSARGYQPGRDLAVIGVDNIPNARFTLTTVALDVELWAESVAVAVIDLIEGNPRTEITGDFLRLIERTSA